MKKSFPVGSAVRKTQNFRKLGKKKEVAWFGFGLGWFFSQMKQEKNSIKRKYMWMQIHIFM